MLILTQSPWSPNDLKTLRELTSSAKSEGVCQSDITDPDILFLLPHSPMINNQAVNEKKVFDSIKKLAMEIKIYIAGSCVLKAHDSPSPQTIGFLISNKGQLLLRVPKISPDLIEGFTNTTSALGEKANFPTVELPFAKVGILCGEDIHFSQYSRVLAFNGAEIILNPSVEKSDHQYDHRIMSRFARASESLAYVAVASPSEINQNGISVKLPSATALYPWEREETGIRGNESFVIPDIDIELLRRKRISPQGSYPAIVRSDVYGRGYRANLKNTNRKVPTTREEWIEESKIRLKEENLQIGPKAKNQEEQYDCMLVQTVARLIPIGSFASHSIPIYISSVFSRYTITSRSSGCLCGLGVPA